MDKTGLVKKVSAISGLPLDKTKVVLDAFMQAIEESMRAHERVAIVGFGTFEVHNVKARTGRNPSTGDTLEIPTKDLVRFRPGKKLVLSKNTTI